MGPSPFYSNNGNRFYVCFIDDFSKFVWLFPMATKSAVVSTFLQFQAHVEKNFDRKTKPFNQIEEGNFGLSILFCLAKEYLIEYLTLTPNNNKVL